MKARRGGGAAWTVRLAGAAAATLLWATSSPVAAASPAPAPAPAQTPTIELFEQTTWVTDTEPFVVQFRVGPTPPDARVRLVVYERLTSRDDFAATLTGELGDDEATMPDQVLAELPRDPLGTMRLTYPVDETGAGLDSTNGYGVYPVKLVVSDAGGDPLTEITTYLLLLPDPGEFPPLSVAPVVEVGTSPGLQPDGNVVLDEEEEAGLRDRVEILEATRQVPLTVAPVPETLDALAQLGPPDDLMLTDLRPTLQDHQILAMPYVPLDLDALTAAQLTDQVTDEVQAGLAPVRNQLQVEPVQIGRAHV